MSEQYTPTTEDVRDALSEWMWHSRTWRPDLIGTDTNGAFDRFLDQVRREARTITREQIATMSRAVAVHAAGNLPGLPDDEFECCFRAALHEAGFIIEQEGKNNE